MLTLPSKKPAERIELSSIQVAAGAISQSGRRASTNLFDRPFRRRMLLKISLEERNILMGVSI